MVSPPLIWTQAFFTLPPVSNSILVYKNSPGIPPPLEAEMNTSRVQGNTLPLNRVSKGVVNPLVEGGVNAPPAKRSAKGAEGRALLLNSFF